jgi:hypothetical protein
VGPCHPSLRIGHFRVGSRRRGTLVGGSSPSAPIWRAIVAQLLTITFLFRHAR